MLNPNPRSGRPVNQPPRAAHFSLNEATMLASSLWPVNASHGSKWVTVYIIEDIKGDEFISVVNFGLKEKTSNCFMLLACAVS